MADDRDVECVVALADELHFGRAAARLGIAQPALSKRIQRLELEWGIQLFTRGRHFVALTDAGTNIVRHARRLEGEFNALRVAATSLATGKLGTVRVGAVGSAFFEALPRLLRPVLQRLPDVKLQVEEMETPAIVEGLQFGELQIGFLRPPVAGALGAKTVWTEELVVATADTDELSREERIDISQLVGREVVFFSRDAGAGYWDHVAALFYAKRVPFHPSERADHVSTLLGLVSLGDGITIVPRSAQNLEIPGVKYIPIDDRTSLPLAIASSPVAISAAAQQILRLLTSPNSAKGSAR